MRFLTVFPLLENVHLIKDVGMIPFVLHRDFGYDSTILSFDDAKGLNHLENEVKGLKIRLIKRDGFYKKGMPSINVLGFLARNAGKIDILNLYHQTIETFAYGLVFKLLNPKGKVYLKLDADLNDLPTDLSIAKKRKSYFFWGFFFNNVAHTVTTETSSTFQAFLHLYPKLKERLLILQNGIDEGWIQKHGIKVRRFQEKENLIISVGRIGTEQKNSELLLDALTKIDLLNWKVAFIGPIHETFKKKIVDYFCQYPHLQEQVLFTGKIENRSELYEWYNRAKIFCLTSRWESFGIVYVEALFFANYIISTKVTSTEDLLNDKIGKIVKDKEQLISTIYNSIKDEDELRNCYSEILEQSSHFYWGQLLKELNSRLRSNDN